MDDYILKINQLLPQLNGAEKRIAEHFLAYRDDLFKLPIKEIAENCQCSQSAIVRFCQKLGYDGFKGFKRQVTASFISQSENSGGRSEHYSDIRINGELNTIIDRITNNALVSIRDTARVLDADELIKAIHVLDKAERIMFFGLATSGIVAGDACQRFSRLGKSCMHFDDMHMQLCVASTLKKGDVAVLISYSGRTEQMVRLMNLFKETGVTTIAITKYGKSPLSRGCDIVLSMLSTDIPVCSASLSTRLSQLAVVDMLFTGVASINYESVEPMLEKGYSLCIGKEKT